MEQTMHNEHDYKSLPFFGIPRLFPYLKKYRKTLTWMVVCGLMGTGVDIMMPVLQRYALNHFITEKTIDTLRAHGGVRADEAGAAILGRRMYSESELRGRLADRGYTDEEIGEAVEKLKEYGFLDDAAYAAALVERAAAKNQSKKALLFELNRRGIDRDTAMDAAEALPGASDALDELIRARLKGAIPDRALTEKTYRYLAGKGFAPGEIRAALRRYTHGEDFDE